MTRGTCSACDGKSHPFFSCCQPLFWRVNRAGADWPSDCDDAHEGAESVATENDEHRDVVNKRSVIIIDEKDRKINSLTKDYG